jgi:hypothetical protein
MAYHERMMLPSHGLTVAQIYVYTELNKIFAFITHCCCCCHVIDTYNQLPGAYQIVVVGMRLFKQQNILYVVDGRCYFYNQETAS